MKYLIALLPLVALASALTQQEQQDHMQYYGNHRRPCGESQFSVLTANSENFTLRTTGIPQHTAYRTSPYRAAIQDLVYSFPREPEPLEHPLCVPNGVPIGFALDGVPFYGPLYKDWNNAVEGSCAKVHDRCGGDVDDHNQYFYPEFPNLDQQCLGLDRNQDSVHLGTAIDGFPIYYERRFNISLLDECGGRYLDPTNHRFYRYVVSEDFPYTLGCFRGKVQNISTLAPCYGHERDHGYLCSCVSVGPHGNAVGYKWLSRDAVTVGQCSRRPTVGERARPLICNRNEIPQPDFLPEDKRPNTCVNFRALYSLLVVMGHKGGLARWTRLRNYGKEEMDPLHEETEYIRHMKALRWVLDDLHVLDYPELAKYAEVVNRTKPLCPKEQRELRNTLAQVWVVAYLREAHMLRRDASDYEKQEAEKKFKQLMYVLKTLKTLEIHPYIKEHDGNAIDPWGIWLHYDDHHEDEEEYKQQEEDKVTAIISQLTALQTLGMMKEKAEQKNGEKKEGGDKSQDMRERILNILWEIQHLSDDEHHEEDNGDKGYNGNGNGCGGEEYHDEDYKAEVKGSNGKGEYCEGEHRGIGNGNGYDKEHNGNGNGNGYDKEHNGNGNGNGYKVEHNGSGSQGQACEGEGSKGNSAKQGDHYYDEWNGEHEMEGGSDGSYANGEGHQEQSRSGGMGGRWADEYDEEHPPCNGGGYRQPPPPRRNGDHPPPRRNGDHPPPRRNGDHPPPRRNGDHPPPRRNGDVMTGGGDREFQRHLDQIIYLISTLRQGRGGNGQRQDDHDYYGY